MLVHRLEQEGALSVVYGSPYYSFLSGLIGDNCRVTIYDPESSRTIYAIGLAGLDLTSMVMLRSSVHIGLQSGRVIELKQDVGVQSQTCDDFGYQ